MEARATLQLVQAVLQDLQDLQLLTTADHCRQTSVHQALEVVEEEEEDSLVERRSECGNW